MSTSGPVTAGHLDAKLSEFRASIESRFDARNAELRVSTESKLDTNTADLRAYLEKRLDDQTRWLIGWMAVLVLGAAGLVIGLG